jgi:hypothetical protein
MLSYEIVSTLFFFVLGVTVAVASWATGFGKWEDPGPGFMGVLSGTALSFLSVLWLGYSLAKKPASGSPPIKFFPEAQSPTRIIRALIPLCGFAIFLESLGFLICTFLFLSILFKEDAKSWSRTLLLSLAVSLATYIVFEVWLHIQFPEGLLPLYRIKKWIF